MMHHVMVIVRACHLVVRDETGLSPVRTAKPHCKVGLFLLYQRFPAHFRQPVKSITLSPLNGYQIPCRLYPIIHLTNCTNLCPGKNKSNALRFPLNLRALMFSTVLFFTIPNSSFYYHKFRNFGGQFAYCVSNSFW